MHTIDTALAFDSSDKAKLKLHVVELLEKTNWKTVDLAFPGVSRASAFRWKKKYLESGKKITSLLPISTRPNKVREMLVPSRILGFIKQLRKKYPRLSKYKIKVFLDIFCEEQGLEKHSVSWIGKVINKYQFFFNKRYPVRQKRRKQKVTRVKYCPKQKDIKLGYLQLDGVTVYFEGRNYYFLCSVELKSRQSWAKRVGSLSSSNAKEFLEEILSQINYPIHTIQTDNGSEFKGFFDKAIKEFDETKHLWSFPRSPKTNGYVERFNWTVQDEFINYEIDTAAYNLKEFDQKLKNWVNYYNKIRPHQSLDYMTPQQYLVQLQKGNSKSLKCV